MIQGMSGLKALLVVLGCVCFLLALGMIVAAHPPVLTVLGITDAGLFFGLLSTIAP